MIIKLTKKIIKNLFNPYKILLKIFDKLNGQTLGKLVLSPTRTYAPVVKEIFKFFRKHINGMIQCTGGGQTKILNFVDNLHIVKNNMFETPPLFKLIKKLISLMFLRFKNK